MACSCSQRKGNTQKTTENVQPTSNDKQTILPTTQCIACAQKHLDEAWVQFTEFGYSNENRRFVRGNLRAIVLHTYKEWPDISELARKCALLVQEAKDKEADDVFQRLCCMVDDEFLKANPDVKRRLLEMQSKEGQ